MDHHNGVLFLICFILIYFSVPVDYVGGVQAALCTKLGAGSLVANLPASTFLLGCVAPIIVSRIVPHRLERPTLVWAYLIMASLMMAVCTTLLLPVANSIRISVLVIQGFVSGLAGSTANVYLYQCLGRGTTTDGRANAATKVTLVLVSSMFAWREALTVVRPDTLIRWHRKGFRLFSRWKTKARGRPHSNLGRVSPIPRSAAGGSNLVGTICRSIIKLWPRLFWVDYITNTDWRGMHLESLESQCG